MDKIYYLNSSSTNYNKTKKFNMSDISYKEIREGRKEIKKLEEKIKAIINAPEDAKVVFNSGATESIATCIHWASFLNPFGVVVGTKFDHSAIAENCNLYGLKYKQYNNLNDKINDRANCIFLTQIDSKTGEIFDVNKFINNFNEYVYINELSSVDFDNMNSNKVLQYRPLIILDATQSIMKEKIDMSKWNIDAVFWSNHKLGGDMNKGVLIINTNHYKFVPLIAGAQNGGFRGGSQSIENILNDSFIYDYKDDIDERKKTWIASYNYLTEKGLNVYKPKGRHLYNTLLLDTGNKCPYSILSELSEQNIYLSPKSACMAEKKYNDKQDNNNLVDMDLLMKGGNEWEEINKINSTDIKPFDNAIRLSFIHGNEINEHVLNTITKTIKQASKIAD